MYIWNDRSDAVATQIYEFMLESQYYTRVRTLGIAFQTMTHRRTKRHNFKVPV